MHGQQNIKTTVYV